MLADTVERPAVEKMVRSFYAKIIQDDLVGPYFIRTLGADLKNDKWHEHFHTLDNFWMLVMTGEKGYFGDPFPAHAFIGVMYTETFDRWLEIFDAHIHEHFVPELAEKFNKKAQIVAERLIEGLEVESMESDE